LYDTFTDGHSQFGDGGEGAWIDEDEDDFDDEDGDPDCRTQ
jgi:hypothetical protein